MREGLPRGFRLGNKCLSGQLALLNRGAGNSIGSRESGGAALLGSLLPSSGVRKNPGWDLASSRHAAILPCFHQLS